MGEEVVEEFINHCCTLSFIYMDVTKVLTSCKFFMDEITTEEASDLR